MLRFEIIFCIFMYQEICGCFKK